MNCQVCYSCFDHSRHKPYSLSCPHTFCISCLNQLKNDLCPLCKNKIKSKHPNLALIEVLPKSSYDLLKEESLNHYYEASELIQTLNNAQETKLVEIKKAREQIKATSDLWIKMVKTHNRELIAKVDALHGKTKEDLNKYNVSKDSTTKLNSLKQLLENNELDEIELNMLNDENIERKSNISKSLNEIENYQKCNFLKNDFIETIALKENLIGQIKTVKEIKDVDKNTVVPKLKKFLIKRNEPIQLSERTNSNINDRLEIQFKKLSIINLNPDFSLTK